MAQLLQPGDKFHLAILLYLNITQLDFTAPFEFFAKVTGIDIRLFWKNHQPIVSAGGLQFTPTATFNQLDSIDMRLCQVVQGKLS